jgi:hypothetical protein
MILGRRSFSNARPEPPAHLHDPNRNSKIQNQKFPSADPRSSYPEGEPNRTNPPIHESTDHKRRSFAFT